MRLLAYLTEASGVGTLLDTRRARDYDADACVDRYLNQPAVKARPGPRQDPSTDMYMSRLLQPCKVLQLEVHCDSCASLKLLLPGVPHQP